MISFSSIEILEGVSGAIAFGILFTYIKYFFRINGIIGAGLPWFSAWFIMKAIVKLSEKTPVAREQAEQKEFINTRGYEILKYMNSVGLETLKNLDFPHPEI